MKRNYFLFLTICQLLCKFVLGDKVTFYDDDNYEGESTTVEVNGCTNVLPFNDRASSVKTSTCVRLFEHIDCGGKRVDIQSPGAPKLSKYGFNDMMTSASGCNGENGGASETVEINMNTRDAPELEEFGRSVKKMMHIWFPFVQNLMTTSAYRPVKTIDVYFDPNYDGVAYASGNRIVGAVRYYKDHQDDYGSFIHEMTHVIHQASTCPGWMVEGYAEWTRRWFYEPWTAREKPSPDQHYTQGYTAAAWLLVYVNSAITGKPMLYLLNKACQEGSWNDSIWEDLTGKTVDQLWSDMMNDENYPWKK